MCSTKLCQVHYELIFLVSACKHSPRPAASRCQSAVRLVWRVYCRNICIYAIIMNVMQATVMNLKEMINIKQLMSIQPAQMTPWLAACGCFFHQRQYLRKKSPVLDFTWLQFGVAVSGLTDWSYTIISKGLLNKEFTSTRGSFESETSLSSFYFFFFFSSAGDKQVVFLKPREITSLNLKRWFGCM